MVNRSRVRAGSTTSRCVSSSSPTVVNRRSVPVCARDVISCATAASSRAATRARRGASSRSLGRAGLRATNRPCVSSRKKVTFRKRNSARECATAESRGDYASSALILARSAFVDSSRKRSSRRLTARANHRSVAVAKPIRSTASATVYQRAIRLRTVSSTQRGLTRSRAAPRRGTRLRVECE